MLKNYLLALMLFGFLNLSAQSSSVSVGNGLKKHNFLYTGEWDHRKPVQTIYLIKDGKVKWTYNIPFKDSTGTMEELGDAMMRPNGNIVFCRKTGVSEVTPDKKIIWNVFAPKGTEIHSVQPIGNTKVMYVINGKPAICRLVDVKTSEVEKELILPTGKPSPHLQFRRVRMLESGNVLAAHLDSNVVSEYDWNGKTVWSFKVNGPWSASRLKNGNTLISSYHNTITEVNAKGEVVWTLNQSDVPQMKLFITQAAERLPNGNTLIANWCPGDVKDPKDWVGTIQLLEVTADKKVVWALSEWSNPDLGPASSFQLLDKKILNAVKLYQ